MYSMQLRTLLVKSENDEEREGREGRAARSERGEKPDASQGPGLWSWCGRLSKAKAKLAEAEAKKKGESGKRNESSTFSGPASKGTGNSTGRGPPELDVDWEDSLPGGSP